VGKQRQRWGNAVLFGWFRKTPVTEPLLSTAYALLSLPDDSFAAVVKEMIENDIPAGHAMIVVAYQNLIPMLLAATSVAEEQGQLFEIEDMI
jgi:hypothetical protein